MPRSQRPELNLQRGVTSDQPRGIESIIQQRARGFLCQAWLDADCELLERLLTKVDAIKEYPSGPWVLDLFERWPWFAVN